MLADRLERALGDQIKLLELTIDERVTSLAALDDPPDRLVELRGVLTNELTVVSPEDPDGTEMLLEPDGDPCRQAFQQALVSDGIPFTSFAVDDVHKEFERLRALGVKFTQEPAELGL